MYVQVKPSDFHFDDMLQLSCCGLQYLTAIAKYTKQLINKGKRSSNGLL